MAPSYKAMKCNGVVLFSLLWFSAGDNNVATSKIACRAVGRPGSTGHNCIGATHPISFHRRRADRETGRQFPSARNFLHSGTSEIGLHQQRCISRQTDRSITERFGAGCQTSNEARTQVRRSHSYDFAAGTSRFKICRGECRWYCGEVDTTAAEAAGVCAESGAKGCKWSLGEDSGTCTR